MFSLGSAWIYNKDLAHKETIDVQLMWQQSFGIHLLSDITMGGGSGVFSPKKMNETCRNRNYLGTECAKLKRFVESGQLSGDAVARKGATRGPIALTFIHFRTVSNLNI